MDKPLSQEDTSSLQRRLLRFALAGVVITTLTVGIASGVVLYSMVKKDQDNALRFATESAAWTLREYLTKTYSVASQVTSRSFARRMLESYNRGAITQRLLAEVSAPEMEDAKNISPEIIGITTLGLDGEPLVSVGVNLPPMDKSLTHAESQTPGIAGPVMLAGQWSLIVAAPVRNAQSIPGCQRGYNLAAVLSATAAPARG